MKMNSELQFLARIWVPLLAIVMGYVLSVGAATAIVGPAGGDPDGGPADYNDIVFSMAYNPSYELYIYEEHNVVFDNENNHNDTYLNTVQCGSFMHYGVDTGPHCCLLAY